MPPTHPGDAAFAILSATLLVIGQFRKVLAHTDDDNKRYLQLTGFSTLVISGVAIAFWVKFGPLGFLVAMWAGRLLSLRLLRYYDSINSDEAVLEMDTSFTDLLTSMSAVAGLAALLLYVAGM
jgi:hypothetical protein